MINYTDEIKAGIESATLRYRPVEQGQLLESITATISIYTPGGAITSVVSQSMQWNSANNTLYYDLDTSESEFNGGKDFRAKITIINDDEIYSREFYFDIVRNPWLAATTTSDLNKLAPLAGYNFGGDFAGYEVALAEAEEQIRIILRTNGFSPGEITERATLDSCHRYLSLSLLYLQNAGNGDKILLAKHEKWQGIYHETMEQLLSKLKLDLNQDGAVDSTTENVYSRRFEP